MSDIVILWNPILAEAKRVFNDRPRSIIVLAFTRKRDVLSMRWHRRKPMFRRFYLLLTGPVPCLQRDAAACEIVRCLREGAGL